MIARRLANAREEMARWSMYDYVVINDKLESAYAKVRAVLAAERVRRERLTGLPTYLEGLLTG